MAQHDQLYEQQQGGGGGDGRGPCPVCSISWTKFSIPQKWCSHGQLNCIAFHAQQWIQRGVLFHTQQCMVDPEEGSLPYTKVVDPEGGVSLPYTAVVDPDPSIQSSSGSRGGFPSILSTGPLVHYGHAQHITTCHAC